MGKLPTGDCTMLSIQFVTIFGAVFSDLSPFTATGSFTLAPETATQCERGFITPFCCPSWLSPGVICPFCLLSIRLWAQADLSPTYPSIRPTCKHMLVAQQKLSGDIKSATIYELKMLHFFIQTWKSVYLSVCKLNTFQ